SADGRADLPARARERPRVHAAKTQPLRGVKTTSFLHGGVEAARKAEGPPATRLVFHRVHRDAVPARPNARIAVRLPRGIGRIRVAPDPPGSRGARRAHLARVARARKPLCPSSHPRDRWL